MCNFFTKKAEFSKNQDVPRHKGLSEICVSWGVRLAHSSAILWLCKPAFAKFYGGSCSAIIPPHPWRINFVRRRRFKDTKTSPTRSVCSKLCLQRFVFGQKQLRKQQKMCNFFNKKAEFSENQHVPHHKGLCEICVSWGVRLAHSSAILWLCRLAFAKFQGTSGSAIIPPRPSRINSVQRRRFKDAKTSPTRSV